MGRHLLVSLRTFLVFTQEYVLRYTKGKLAFKANADTCAQHLSPTALQSACYFFLPSSVSPTKAETQ